MEEVAASSLNEFVTASNGSQDFTQNMRTAFWCVGSGNSSYELCLTEKTDFQSATWLCWVLLGLLFSFSLARARLPKNPRNTVVIKQFLTQF